MLAEARAVYGSGHVALTGGEPTLHPEFAAVLDAIVEHGFAWHMVTNAKRFEPGVALLKRCPHGAGSSRPSTSASTAPTRRRTTRIRGERAVSAT